MSMVFFQAAEGDFGLENRKNKALLPFWTNGKPPSKAISLNKAFIGGEGFPSKREWLQKPRKFCRQMVQKVMIKVFHAARGFWLVLGALVLFLVVLELGSTILILTVRGHIHDRDPRKAFFKNSPAQFSALMNEKVIEEEIHADQKPVWHSYVYWRMRPFWGKYIQVDANGLRRTINVHSSAGKPFKIFMFGGSTMFGTCLADADTIPSNLSKLFLQRGIPVEITNYGQPGYVSTQALLTLMFELRKGNVPDLVVFYDGINDILAGAANGSAGQPINEVNRIKEFNLTQKSETPELLYDFMQNVLPLTSRVFAYVKKKTSMPASDFRTPELADEILTDYAWNVHQVEELGRTQRFKTLFYWHPVVSTKRHPTPYEQYMTQMAEKYVPGQTAFINLVYDRLNGFKNLSSDSEFHNLSGVFNQETQTIYTDTIHVTKTGNQIVAKRMFPHVLKGLKAAR